MKLTKDLQEVLAIVHLNSQLGQIFDIEDLLPHIPKELLDALHAHLKTGNILQELINQWLEKNLESEEHDSDKTTH